MADAYTGARGFSTPLWEPTTPAVSEEVTSPFGDYTPMSFGPMGRGWPARIEFGGTYDQNWIDNVFPFLPADFDERHYQAAPEDQQIPHPKGGEEIVLMNLTPAGRTAFKLPPLHLPVTFYPRHGEESAAAAVADTLFFEPEANRFTVTWRTSLPLKKNMLEIAQVVVGRMSRGWHRAREGGKKWYPSLDALVRERLAEEEEAFR